MSYTAKLFLNVFAPIWILPSKVFTFLFAITSNTISLSVCLIVLKTFKLLGNLTFPDKFVPTIERVAFSPAFTAFG